MSFLRITRALHSTHVRFKRKPKNENLKSMVKTMKGDSLPQTGKQPSQSPIQNSYDTVAFMTPEDLKIQLNMDQGRQFQAFPSEHYLDRKKLLRNLPDEIDVANTSLLEIKRIYDDLKKLDDDKAVHLKYYKRYLNNSSDPITLILQEFNGISKKFKLLRRGEIDHLNLGSNAYLYKENLFGLQYNILGFDRSLSGFPLVHHNQKSTEQSFPLEFIQDLQESKDFIKLHKKDLNFIEDIGRSLAIDPSSLDKDFSDTSSQVKYVYDELDIPKSFIVVQSLGDYKVLKFKYLNKFNSILQTEINTLKSTLQKEIELVITLNNTAQNLLLFNQQFFKTNQFKLCALTVDPNIESHSPTKSKLFIVRYNTKDFNLIPYHILVDKSVRAKKQLFNHFFKLFRINLSDQIETLMRIKYMNNGQLFINSLNTKLTKIINYKLIKLFKTINDANFSTSLPMSFKPYDSKNFKRVYNYRLKRHVPKKGTKEARHLYMRQLEWFV